MEYSCCHKPYRSIDGKRLLLTCVQCKCHYHIACVLPARRDWVPDTAYRSKWVCFSCAQSGPRDNKDDTPITPTTKPKSPTKSDSSVAKPSPINTGPTVVSPAPGMQVVPLDQVTNIVKTAVRDAVADFKQMLVDLKNEVSTLKESVKFISDKYEIVTKKMDDINRELKVIPNMKHDIANIDNKIKQIQHEFELRDQWARRSNLEIIGIPEKKGENLINVISKLAQFADAKLNPDTEIDFITRVAPVDKSVKKAKPIIVRFISRYRKDEFLAKVRSIKEFRASDIGFSQDSSRLYFNDHLTKNNKLLLQNVTKTVKDKLYKYVWVRNCTIMVRKNDTSPVIHISSPDDLKKIV